MEKGGGGSEKKAILDIQQTAEKGRCRIESGEGKMAPQFSQSEIHEDVRSEARGMKE
jgi:hypothetical protein